MDALLNKYKGSSVQLLKTVYPEYPSISMRMRYVEFSIHKNLFHVLEYKWDTSKFQSRHGYWDDIENQRSFMEELGKKLHVTNPSDWYLLNPTTLKRFGGEVLLDVKYNGSISKLVASVFPEYHVT